MVAAIVGHEAGNIADDFPFRGSSDALRREVVKSVRLPQEGWGANAEGCRWST